jgi:hypothetical protein
LARPSSPSPSLPHGLLFPWPISSLGPSLFFPLFSPAWAARWPVFPSPSVRASLSSRCQPGPARQRPPSPSSLLLRRNLPPRDPRRAPLLGPARQWDRRHPTKSRPNHLHPNPSSCVARGSPAPPPLFPPPPITSAPPWARRRTAPQPARACASTPPHHPGAPEPFTSDLGPFLGLNFPQSAAAGKSSAAEIARRR